MLSFLLPIIYLAFISLGLPDSALGSAWPTMYPELGVPVSYAGIISAIIALGTIVSSLLSTRLISVLRTGGVTAVSVSMTAVALLGFYLSHSFWALCVWAVPYGLGAGSVDAALNNFVALHYKSHHMSWLHCMWGLGATAGPVIMGRILTANIPWNYGFLVLFAVQAALAIVMFVMIPLWKEIEADDKAEQLEGGRPEAEEESFRPRPLKEIIKVPGVKEMMIAFFCYCALEQTTGLWTASYLTLHTGLTAGAAAEYASMAFLGITIGRALNGFLTFRFSDDQLIHLGELLIGLGVLLILLPLHLTPVTLIGILLVGFGCAPIYPCIIHATPDHFGKRGSQEIIGVQMASAYVGTMVMPPLFGFLADHISIGLWPVYLLVILVLMVLMYEQVRRKTRTDRGRS